MSKYIEDLVSVIIPVYNSEKYIKFALDSVIEQNYNNIEIIIVDDASEDSSSAIINTYLRKYDNIKYYINHTNVGVGQTRNVGLYYARGRYVAFMDADDIWDKDKIKCQIKLMNREKCPFCFTAIDMVDEDGNVINGKRSIIKKVDYKILLKNTVIPTSSVVLDRNILGNVKMSCRRSGQDYATWLKILRNGVVARGIDKELTHYRITSGSLSSNKIKSILQVWSIQVSQEQINPIRATVNTMFFIINAMKKYMCGTTKNYINVKGK